MAILAYDDVMLREPRLLVPGMQPIGRVKANLPARGDIALPTETGKSFFSVVHGQFLKTIVAVQHITDRGRFIQSTASDAYCLSNVYVAPPVNLTILCVAKSVANWVSGSDFFPSAGFCYTGADSTAHVGGNACLDLGMFYDNFGAKVLNTGLTYSDGTTANIQLSGDSTTSRDTYAGLVSVESGARCVLAAKNLNTGAVFSSTTAISKTLNSVSQPFQITGIAPKLTTYGYARANTVAAVGMAAWMAKAVTVSEAIAIVSDPYQFLIPA